jgi:hypothetical protein
VQEVVIGAVLMQEVEAKEHIKVHLCK